MTELKPCAYCGSDAFFSPKMNGEHAIVFCKGRCRANPMVCADTDEEAAEIWNTRYEPTCEMLTNLKSMGIVGCSECGMTTHFLDLLPKYCQHCGMKFKVIEE